MTEFISEIQMCSSGYVLFQDNLVWFWWKLESQIQNWNFTSTVLKLKYRREYFRLSFNNIGGKIKYLTLTERNKVDKTLELQTIHQFSKSRRRALLGPSPGWKHLLALSHLRHYDDTMLNRRLNMLSRHGFGTQMQLS